MIRKEATVLFLEGNCEVEEAEAIMEALQGEVTAFDLSCCRRLHTAILQIVIAAGLKVRANHSDPMLAALVRGQPSATQA